MKTLSGISTKEKYFNYMSILTINGKVLQSSSGKLLTAPSVYVIKITCNQYDQMIIKPISSPISVYQCDATGDVPNEEWIQVQPHIETLNILRAVAPDDGGMFTNNYSISKKFIRVDLNEYGRSLGLTSVMHAEEANSDVYCTPWIGLTVSDAGEIYQIPQYTDNGTLIKQVYVYYR